MSCHSCWLTTVNPPERIFLQLILIRVARSQLTKLNVQMLSTSTQHLTSWLPLLKMTTPTLINMANSLISLQSLFTIKARSKSRGSKDKRSKSSGYVSLNKTQIIKMGSLTFISHDYRLLIQTMWLSGTVSSHYLMSCTPST